MKLVYTIQDLQTELDKCKQLHQTIGFAPTMGALHEGHGSLMIKSVSENDITVASVFVNPTQFNDQNDLLKYPRTLEADSALLEKCGVDIVFVPDVKEMYPEKDTRQFNYAPLDSVMEGAHRPGHFNGVCQIVSKLFDAVMPNKAYFGEKDYQQLAIIKEMVRDLKYPIDIIGCPIIRESDGLALSSRNMRLSKAERENALNISQTLFKSCTFATNHSVNETLEMVKTAINNAPGLELEYFEIVDGDTLQPINNWDDSSSIMGCITVFCGPVRLIDNIRYK